MFKNLVLALVMATLFVSNSFAGTIFNFYSWQNSGAGFGNSDLNFTVEVSDAGSIENSGDRRTSGAHNHQMVSFKFRNQSSVGSSIKEIFFDDGTLLRIPGESAIRNGDGGNGDAGGDVNFQENNKANFAGGNTIDWNTTTAMDAKNAGLNGEGIDQGESLEVLIELQHGVTFEDTLAAMALSQQDPYSDIVGGLRIGIHVGSLGGDGGPSDSFINGGAGGGPLPGSGVGEVPEPTSALIWGLLGLTGVSIRRKRAARK